MTTKTPARAIQAANDNPGGSGSATLAMTGLITLLARAEAQREARRQPANINAAPCGSPRVSEE